MKHKNEFRDRRADANRQINGNLGALEAPLTFRCSGREGSSMRILLVEDESKVARFIARGLTADHFAVDTAADGTSGLELATTYQYDLIILDLMLPGTNGTALLRHIRSKDTNVPVL